MNMGDGPFNRGVRRLKKSKQMKLQEEDRNRYNILIDRRTEVFERMQNNISNLISRNIALVSIILPILSIALTVVLYLPQQGWKPSDVDLVLLITFFVFLVISLAINISIFHPTDYKDLNVFGKTTLDELIAKSEQDLLSHFLYYFEETYSHNKNIYDERMWLFTYALRLFIAANITFIILIIKNIVWR
jgi:hypothetical protein